MKSHAVILLGEISSGKSELSKRLVQDSTYSADYNATVGADLKVKVIDGRNKLVIWDMSGDDKFSDLLSPYYNQANVAVLCVDLSKEINKEQIQKKIERFTLVNNGPVILVGTKSDLPEAQAHIQEFSQLNLCEKTFITSAKDELQISELLEGITQACGIKPLPEQWDAAVKELSSHINTLPQKKRDAIELELDQLKEIMVPTALRDVDNELRQQAIERFQKRCHDILNGDYANVWSAILMVVAAAVVTVISTMLGFAIGFALGAWTGPGAFITALVGADAAAASVIGASTTLGGGAALTAYGLFKNPKEIAAIDEFINESCIQTQVN